MESGSAYMLIFRETSPERYETMSAEQLRECLDEWNAWGDGLVATGKMAHGHPLAPEGRLVSGSRDGSVTDGPFAEAKEVVGGYFLLEVADLEEATAIAWRCPTLKYGMTVEIRPVAGGCHLARALGWDTMHEPVGA